LSKFVYYQTVGGEEKWKPMKVSEVDKLDPPPMFVTILAVEALLTDEMTREQLQEIKYLGPMYFDFDSADPASTAEDVMLFLSKIEDKGVNLNHVNVYATGVKGFHVTIPPGVFMSKVPKVGIPHLPQIYKEIAYAYATPSMDLVIYSGRKGRMFRKENVLRPQGSYKVQIHQDELENMTAERYKEICSEPRGNPHGVFPEKPELAYEFMAVFDEARTKVTKAFQGRKKQKTLDMPKNMPTFDALLRGEGIKPGTGFQELAMQIGITAAARGMTEQDLIEASKGLCETHESDGSRYNTPEKRKAELVRMWAYMDSNPCYSYNSKAIETLLVHKAPDLHGIDMTPEEYQAMLDSGGADNIENPEVNANGEEFDYAKVIMTRKGTFALTEDGNKKLSSLSLENVTELTSVDTGTVSAFEADIYVAGKRQGRHSLELSNLDSAHAINALAMRHGQTFMGTDNAAKGFYLQTVQSARVGKRRMYILNREGVDLVSLNQHEDPDLQKKFLVWADGRGVVCPDWVTEKGVQFRFMGDPDPRGTMQTDLSNAPDLVPWLTQTTEVDEAHIGAGGVRVHTSRIVENKVLLQDFLDNLLHSQSPEIVGRLLGWTAACNYRMLLNARYQKFPILHIAGAAGQGKCLGKNTPVLMADGSTKFVQDVVVGDQLLGPDGKARNILSTCFGREDLYEINPLDSEATAYVVNGSHILSFMTSEGEIKNLVTEEVYSTHLVDGAYQGWRVPGVLKGDLTAQRYKLTIRKLEVGDYYGFTLDGDHLFMLGDFTVTHNTEMTKLFCNLHSYEVEPVMLSPQSTVFAAVQSASGSASIPLILDEFKPEAMSNEQYGRFKLFIRDCYNNRQIEKGGGNRDNSNFKALTRTQLSAPIVFIAENMETEPALMERVIFITMVKPASVVLAKYKKHFDAAVKFKSLLGILGKYMAANVVKNCTLKTLENEFAAVLVEAETRLLGRSLEEVLLGGDGFKRSIEAKERTVYNYATARFGLIQFEKILKDLFGDRYDSAFRAMQNPMDRSMLQLLDHTTPEWIKVLNAMQDLAVQDPTSSSYIKQGTDFEHVMYAGQECLEIYARSIYHKYRYYVASAQMKPLFTSEDSFIHAIETAVPCVAANTCCELKTPGGSHLFRIDQLLSQGFKDFSSD